MLETHPPLYYLLVGRRMESVLGVHEYRRGLNARSLDEYASALPLCYTPFNVEFNPLGPGVF